VSLEAYRAFLQGLVEERNLGRAARLAEERSVLRALPVRQLPAYRELVATVSRWSTIRVVAKTYSVPSRLRGYRVEVHLYAAELEVRYGGRVIERYDRLRGRGAYRIDYRHVIHSLVRKPGAFRRYVYREALFPTLTFRRCYDVLVERSQHWADLEYVRILHLAATTMETRVEAVLVSLLAEGVVPDYDVVKARVAPAPRAPFPEVRVSMPDLKGYDALIGAEEVTA
jgi:hypothetical protein